MVRKHLNNCHPQCGLAVALASGVLGCFVCLVELPRDSSSLASHQQCSASAGALRSHRPFTMPSHSIFPRFQVNYSSYHSFLLQNQLLLSCPGLQMVCLFFPSFFCSLPEGFCPYGPGLCPLHQQCCITSSPTMLKSI